MKNRLSLVPHIAALRRRFASTDEFAVNRRFIAGDNYAYNIAVNLAGGSFFTGYLLLLHADNAFLGLVTMATLLGNSLQFLSPILLNRFPRRRPILIGTRAVFLLINIVLIGAAQYLPIPSQLVFVLAAAFLMNSVSALVQPGVLVWHIRSIPDATRVRFFSFISLSVNVTMYAAILIGSRVVDTFKAGGNEMLGLTVLRAVAVGVAVLDLLSMSRIREYPEPPASSALRTLLNPFRTPRYLATVAVTCLWSFAANLSGPYFTAYLLQDVQIEYTVLNLVGAMIVPVMLLTTPFWRRHIERSDLRKAFRLCLALFSLHYFVIAFTTKATLLLYPIAALYSFVMVTGMNIVMANMPFLHMPDDDRTTAIGFYAAVNAVAALLGVLVGREFVDLTATLGLSVFGIHLGNRQLVMVLTGSTMLLSALALRWFPTLRAGLTGRRTAAEADG